MIVEGIEKLYSLSVRGSFGYSNGFGRIRYGKSLYGLFLDACGIYSRKKTLTGFKTSRMSFYAPSNPQTTGQQAWRAVFAAGKVAYDALTTPQKVLLSKEARDYRMTGYNLFMRRYLQANRL